MNQQFDDAKEIVRTWESNLPAAGVRLSVKSIEARRVIEYIRALEEEIAEPSDAPAFFGTMLLAEPAEDANEDANG